MGNAKKYVYEEYFVNDNQIKKLYNMYVEKHVLGKILDICVMFAIISTVTGVVLDFLGVVDNDLIVFLHSISALVIFIFALELLRHYAKSKNGKEFIKKYWIDFVLIVFLSFYFVFITFLDMIKFVIFDTLKPFFQDTKYARIFYKIFKRRIN